METKNYGDDEISLENYASYSVRLPIIDSYYVEKD